MEAEIPPRINWMMAEASAGHQKEGLAERPRKSV